MLALPGASTDLGKKKERNEQMSDEGIAPHGETRWRELMADNEDVLTFFDAMAADYHLIFQDWVQASAQQGHRLDHLIRAHVDESRNPLTVLDCACGIGTQAIGLAKQGGYHIQPRTSVRKRWRGQSLKPSEQGSV
jgi:2-polyprenyl-3-methyl-5-hydroxy-6-metoxy-1,4-benzoquinol methylase